MGVWACSSGLSIGCSKTYHRTVHGIPGTSDQDEGILLGPPAMPQRSLPPPPQAVAAEAGQEGRTGDVSMAETPRVVAPSTPLGAQGLGVLSTPRADALEALMPASGEHVYDELESDRPLKVPRVLAVQFKVLTMRMKTCLFFFRPQTLMRLSLMITTLWMSAGMVKTC